MNDRLSPLVIVPAKLEHAPVQESVVSVAWRISESPSVSLPSRLLWCDPPWYRYENTLADMIAIAVARLGITVTATKWDLSTDQSPTAFHDEASTRSRMLPYRPERFRVTPDDFHQVTSIDLRLLPERDPSGAAFYDVAKVSHFSVMESDENHSDDQPLSASSLPSLTLPPDIQSVDQLQPKISQLRALAPSAAVFVSILPYRIDADVPTIAAQRPDGLILRCEDASIDGLRLVRLLSAGIKLATQPESSVPILIAPGKVTTSDVIKLFRLGASAVAVDSWCNDLLDSIDERLSQPTIGGTVDQASIESLANEILADRIERVTASQKRQQFSSLASANLEWKELLGAT